MNKRIEDVMTVDSSQIGDLIKDLYQYFGQQCKFTEQGLQRLDGGWPTAKDYERICKKHGIDYLGVSFVFIVVTAILIRDGVLNFNQVNTDLN